MRTSLLSEGGAWVCCIWFSLHHSGCRSGLDHSLKAEPHTELIQPHKPHRCLKVYAHWFSRKTQFMWINYETSISFRYETQIPIYNTIGFHCLGVLLKIAFLSTTKCRDGLHHKTRLERNGRLLLFSQDPLELTLLGNQAEWEGHIVT